MEVDRLKILIFAGGILSGKKIGLEAQALLKGTRQGIKPISCRLQNKSIYHTLILTKQNRNGEVMKWKHGSGKDKKQKGG